MRKHPPNQFMYKQGGRKPNPIVQGLVEHLTAPLTGGVVSAEVGANLRDEGSLLSGNLPATLRLFSDGEVRNDFGLGTLVGISGGFSAKKLMNTVAPEASLKNRAATIAGGSIATSIWEPSIRNSAVGLINSGRAAVEANDLKKLELDLEQKKLDLESQQSEENSGILSNKNLILGALGVGALGLGGYALYRYLKNKEEEKDTPPKVKVRIKGNTNDPYDDATVEVPLHNLKITQNLEQGVNRSMKRVIRENNKFSGKKKDPITGQLISYQEYVDKYGEPDKNKKKFSPDMLPQYGTVDRESEYMNPVNTYSQYNASI